MKSTTRGGPPSSVATIGGDDAEKSFTMQYTDERGVSRLYRMELTAGKWELQRVAPGFSQRFLANIAPDKKVIRGAWEKSADGKAWQHDFDMIYTKHSV